MPQKPDPQTPASLRKPANTFGKKPTFDGTGAKLRKPANTFGKKPVDAGPNKLAAPYAAWLKKNGK